MLYFVQNVMESYMLIVLIHIAVVVGFTQSVYLATEEDSFGNALVLGVDLSLEGQIDRSVTVFISTLDGSAIGMLYSNRNVAECCALAASALQLAWHTCVLCTRWGLN